MKQAYETDAEELLREQQTDAARGLTAAEAVMVGQTMAVPRHGLYLRAARSQPCAAARCCTSTA